MVIEKISTDLGESAVAAACLNILKNLSELPDDQTKYIPMPTILKYSNSADLNTAVLAAEYLSRMDVAILTLFFDLVDEDGGHHLIELSEYCEAKAGKGLAHPDRGVVVHDLEQHIFPFYSANLR